jgi:hypothetical protein
LNGFNRANLIPGQSLNLNLNSYYQNLGCQNGCSTPPATAFNTNAFAPAGFTGGNSPRAIAGLRNSFNSDEDIALAKHLRFTERVEGELRMEFFNILNRAQVCGFDTNVTDGPLRFGVVNPNGTGGSRPCQSNRPRQGEAFFKLRF